MNYVAALLFLLFVACGILVAAARRYAVEPALLRRFTNVFICVVLFVSFAAGITQRDMWPFSSWTMMVGLTPPATRSIPTLRIVGVDANSIEHEIDYRAWQPLSLEELQSWMKNHLFALDQSSKDRVGLYLLNAANLARRQALSLSGLPYPSRFLGRFTAPTHVLHPALWSHPQGVPQTEFTALRIYEESWDLEARGDSARKINRILKYEYRQR